MARSFEELAGGQLDALYQGALFLAAGERVNAERLLVDAVTLVFRESMRAPVSPDTDRWFEGRLVRSFLLHQPGGPVVAPPLASERIGPDPELLAALGSEELFRAARVLPARPRAALWLVLLRRWRYADAAAVMDADPRLMGAMLGYRDVLLAELMRASGSSRRNTGTA